MQYVFFALIILFYLYRTFSTAQKKAREDAERRRKLNPQTPQQPNSPELPKTFQDMMTEVFREAEMKTKPYGDGRTMPPVVRQKKQYEPRRTFQNPPPKTIPPKIQLPKKKEASPFLTTDYTPEILEPEGTPSTMLQEYSKQNSEAYLIKDQDGNHLRFNIRDAVIAKIILDRPEWD